MLINDQYEEWLAFAKHDLAGAYWLHEKPEFAAMVVYHAHQAVEKLLKSKLIQRHIPIPHSHFLLGLYRILIEVDEQIPDCLRELSVLQEYYPMLRYPHDDELDNNDATDALEMAKTIFMKWEIKQRSNSDESTSA